MTPAIILNKAEIQIYRQGLSSPHKGVESMKKYSDLEFLRLSKWNKFVYKFLSFFAAIPKAILNFFVKIGKGIGGFFAAIGRELADIATTFVKGDWKTKISYFVMGFGSCARGQWLRGIMFFLFEVVFIGYMITTGGYWLSMLPSLGYQGREKIITTQTQFGRTVEIESFQYHDNSFRILLYGVLTIFFIIAFIYTWRSNIKQNKISEKIIRSGKKLKSGKDDLRSLVDDNFHRTLLALPLTGILIFTVLPLFFMILVAFTNYDFRHDGLINLFHWQGLAGFKEMLTWSSGGVNYSAAFGEILTWTLIWAFFATFTNYFLGMFVAMMINKKGIRLKKLWRTILILTIAIPQFISLLYVSKMFADNGLINLALLDAGWITKPIGFWSDPANHGLLAKIMVIIINIWVGIPYLMLVATGILMNIPADLYESAKIDGASGWKQFSKITLPYMLFITGPYLLTQFTGNMNNFNLIFLLTGGAPTNAALSGASSVGYTDLFITWIFKMINGAEPKYYLASVVGILIFIVVAVISLIVYSVLPSVKNEEDFQ